MMQNQNQSLHQMNEILKTLGDQYIDRQVSEYDPVQYQQFPCQ